MRVFSLSDVGLIRKNNQDSYINVYNENKDLLALICDGIGGAKAGEVASLEIVKYFGEVFSKHQGFKDAEDAISYLKYHVRMASDHVYEMSKSDPRYEGMGTTIVGLLISDIGNFVINAGDSRVYAYHDGNLRQLTSDHTLVNELIKRRLITEEEGKTHPKRHYLTRFLGVYEGATCEVYAISNFSEYYLLSSDGLHGYVEKEQMAAIIADPSFTIEEKANYLLKSALAKGGYDNITLTLIAMDKEDDHG